MEAFTEKNNYSQVKYFIGGGSEAKTWKISALNLSAPKHKRSVLKKIISKIFDFSRKSEQKLPGLEKQKDNKLRTENIYVTISELYPKNPPTETPIFRLDNSECASCIFGDPSLTCTCNFRSNSPDFKLYEDDQQFLQIYNI